jgi:hypothetical protein
MHKEKKRKPRPLGKGGYPSGDKPVSELSPPPPGPGVGARSPAQDDKEANPPAKAS